MPSDAPERIYLQWGEPDVPGGPPPDLWDVSWCEDRTEASDVAYVRADHVTDLERQRDALANALDDLSFHSTHLEPCPGWVCVPQVEWDAAMAQWDQVIAARAVADLRWALVQKKRADTAAWRKTERGGMM